MPVALCLSVFDVLAHCAHHSFETPNPCIWRLCCMFSISSFCNMSSRVPYPPFVRQQRVKRLLPHPQTANLRARLSCHVLHAILVRIYIVCELSILTHDVSPFIVIVTRSALPVPAQFTQNPSNLTPYGMRNAYTCSLGF